MGAGPRVAFSTAAFHADTGFVPRFVPLSRRFERNKNVSSPSTRIWRAVSSHSYHHPHEVIMAKFSPPCRDFSCIVLTVVGSTPCTQVEFSLYVHTGGLKSHSFHVHFLTIFRKEIEIVDKTRHFVTDISRLRPTKACLGAGVRFRS